MDKSDHFKLRRYRARAKGKRLLAKLPQIDKRLLERLPRIDKKKKGALLSLFTLMLLAGTLVFTPAGKVVAAVAVKRDLPIYCVKKDDNVVSLTFDAAWGNEDTAQLIEILGKYKVKATFFVVGDWVDRFPESVLALHQAGHEVMNHSNKHDHFNKLSVEQIISDITACDDKIEAVTGVRPTLFRPPYGEYNDRVVSTLRNMGHFTIQWDVDSRVI